jgi:hypothetical protein
MLTKPKVNTGKGIVLELDMIPARKIRGGILCPFIILVIELGRQQVPQLGVFKNGLLLQSIRQIPIKHWDLLACCLTYGSIVNVST